MSAREILEAQGVPEDVIDGILCIHAHELAEKIRAEKDTTSLESAAMFFGGMDYAADLIDPEVKS